MRGRVLLALLALGLVACGIPGPYRKVTLTFDGRAPAALGADPDDLTIAWVAAHLLHEKLGLPFPADTAVHLYVNQGALAEGLIRDGGLEAGDAWDKSRFAGGVASRRGIFLRADVLVSMRLIDRIGLIAHELTHVSQIEMARGGRRSPAVWIREGHADWARYRVLELLGIRSYADSREEVRRSLLRSATPIGLFPKLGELRNNEQWTAARNRLGSAATYGQAFLAIDWLVERHGAERLHELIRRFARDADSGASWRELFSGTAAEFVEEFRARLRALAQ